MKLCFHPISTNSRPVQLFAADHSRWRNLIHWIATMKVHPELRAAHEAFCTHLVAPTGRGRKLRAAVIQRSAR